ncbi:hypothetical protein [Photobacterium minamisatsumaniensis]|uniref:hypothetical protein n=1 Tax=Photobacterium minamisatsumaniensis TaxID=2910233 RepID=UPI003D113799
MAANTTNKTLTYHQMRLMVTLTIIVSLIVSNVLSSLVVLNPDQNNIARNWLTGDKVLICTSEGLQWININTLKGKNNHHDSENHSAEHQSLVKFHCPIFKLQQVALNDFSGPFLAFVTLSAQLPAEIKLNYIPIITRLYYDYAPKHSPPYLAKYSPKYKIQK